jgi:peptidoglycan hydrolase CwlO-like protein
MSLHLSLVANLVQGSLSQKDSEIHGLKEELSRERKQIQELKEELSQQRKQIQELKQQHTNLQTMQRSTQEEIRIFRGELRRERRTNHNRCWTVL